MSRNGYLDPVIREALPEDFGAVMRLYRQLNPGDPVVDEAMRGTGLGKQIMAATLQAAWDAGCYKAMLLTGSKTPSTHAFYRSCGFSPDAKTAYLARPTPRAVPTDHLWFQQRESEVDQHVAAGRLTAHESTEDFLSHLDSLETDHHR